MSDDAFFDVDGTLHGGDLFGHYLLHLARTRPLRLALTWPLVVTALLCYLLRPHGRRSLGFLLWTLTVGLSEAALQRGTQRCLRAFWMRGERHPAVWAALERHLARGDRVWLISGSPECLLRGLYPRFDDDSRVRIIGSRMAPFLGGQVLAMRCISLEKARQLDLRAQREVTFRAGYSDSAQDMPLLMRCRRAYKVERAGCITRWH